jgi:hypothetical protein
MVLGARRSKREFGEAKVKKKMETDVRKRSAGGGVLKTCTSAYLCYFYFTSIVINPRFKVQKRYGTLQIRSIGNNE